MYGNSYMYVIYAYMYMYLYVRRYCYVLYVHTLRMYIRTYSHSMIYVWIQLTVLKILL